MALKALRDTPPQPDHTDISLTSLPHTLLLPTLLHSHWPTCSSSSVFQLQLFLLPGMLFL